MTDFLQTLNKLFSNKRRQIYKNKQKASIKETSLKKPLLAVWKTLIEKNY